MAGKMEDWRWPRKKGGAAEKEGGNRNHCQGGRRHATTTKMFWGLGCQSNRVVCRSAIVHYLLFVFVLAGRGGLASIAAMARNRRCMPDKSLHLELRPVLRFQTSDGSFLSCCRCVSCQNSDKMHGRAQHHIWPCWRHAACDPGRGGTRPSLPFVCRLLIVLFGGFVCADMARRAVLPGCRSQHRKIGVIKARHQMLRGVFKEFTQIALTTAASATQLSSVHFRI